jgi:hypothetical protein
MVPSFDDASFFFSCKSVAFGQPLFTQTMNSPNYDSSGGDFEPWDGRGEIEWTESDWKQFLRDSDGEIGRFIEVYQSLRGHPQRIDQTALAMNWDSGDWSMEQVVDEDELRTEWKDGSDEDEDEDYGDLDDEDPYTIHRHPLYVTTRGFYYLFSYYWRIVTEQASELVNAAQSHAFDESLRMGEVNAVMAIHALEMGDYRLVVCHLQRALASLNESLEAFQRLCADETVEEQSEFVQEFHAWFFDLREVWLRVIRECRNPGEFQL